MNATRFGLLAAALACLVPAPSLAASLDKGLLDAAEPILVALKKAGITRVGVLPFEVRKGKRTASLDSAPLSAGIVARLENALVLRQANSSRTPVVAMRGMGAGGWRTSEQAFKRLFSTRLSPAWGDARGKAEAFLTGSVSNTGDRKQTEIVVALVVPGSWKDSKAKPKEIHRFKVKTDRSLLRDLGYAVAIPVARTIKKKTTADDLDSDAIEEAKGEEEGTKKEPPVTDAASHNPENVAGMRLEIEYDGVKQEITALPGTEDGARQSVFQVVAARPGQKVAIFLTRLSDDPAKLGAVLRVNGKSVYNEEDGEPLTCKKWIYDVKKKDRREDFVGFYSKNEKGKLTVRPWKVLTGDEAREREAELGPRVGWIDLDVFTSRGADAPVDEAGPVFSTRSVPKKRAKTLREAREALARANRLGFSILRSRSLEGVMVADVEALPAGPVGTDKLPNPVRLGGISIRYVESK